MTAVTYIGAHTPLYTYIGVYFLSTKVHGLGWIFNVYIYVCTLKHIYCLFKCYQILLDLMLENNAYNDFFAV